MGWQDDQVVAQSQTGAAWEQDEIVSAPKQAQQSNLSGSAVAGAHRGVAGILGMPVDTLLNVADLGIAGYGTGAALMGRPDLAPDPIDRRNVLASGENIASVMNRLGILTRPQGETTGDRYAYGAGMGATAGALGPQNALANTLRGTLGGVASVGAMDATGDPAAAAAAALGASAVPTGGMAVARGAVRGGEQGRQAMERTISDFARVGAKPSLGQATQNRGWRAIETAISRIPGGAGVMANRAEAQQTAIGAGADRIASDLAPKSSATTAGMKISQGITDVFLPEVRARQQGLYATLDSKINPQASVPITNTYAALDKISQGIASAPAVSGTKLIRNSVADDLLAGIKQDAPYGGLPYEALKEMRTRIGERLNDFDLAPDVPRQQLKQIYAGLTEDMKVAATLNGPEAVAAFQRANNYTRSMHDRIERLQTVVDKAGGPEKVFLAATSGTGEGATTLRTVMKSLPQEGQAALTSSVIRRLGRATPGKQNDVGDQFSTETFLTNWSKLSPEAKGSLAGPFGPQFKRDIDALASVANNLRQGSKVFANPSGTASGTANIAAVSALAGAVASGQLHVAAGIAGGIGASNLAARFLNNQGFIRNMAQVTRLPPDVLTSQIVNLNQTQDREADQP